MNDLPNVAICHPYYRVWEGSMGACAEAMAYRCARFVNAGVFRCSGAYIEDNRNACVRLAFKTGIPFDWLLWIDTDMEFPADALLQLLSDNPPERFKQMPAGWTGKKDIIGANYRVREPPYGFCGHYADGMDTHLEEPGLWPMDHLPTGFMLTRFDIYRKLPDPWFERPNERHADRDDVFFCRNARAAGYEIWCDHDLTDQIGHRGDSTIPWFTVEKRMRDSLRVKGAELWTHEKQGLTAPKVGSVDFIKQAAE